jgi:sulfatase modifying factor 1
VVRRGRAVAGVLGLLSAVGCNSILGIDDHSLASDASSSAASESGGGGDDARAEGSVGGDDSAGGGVDATSPESGTDGGAARPNDAGADALRDATTDATTADAGSEGGCSCPVDRPTCAGGQCTVRGPTMVAVGSYYVDSTEVTSAQYQEFLSAKAGDTSGQPSVCAWNTSYAPAAGENPPTDPVTSVNWCDAVAFCTWAGKHLCGAIGGGPLATGSVTDPTMGQWILACGGPNGADEPNPTAVCNASQGTGDLAPVASYTGCEGFYTGLFDLSGNASEWIDSCEGPGADGGATDTCYLLGGSFYDESSYCNQVPTTYPRNGVSYGFGFRCCGG